MNLWLAISLVIAVISIYLLPIEIYSVAFKLTGLSTSKVRFQVGSLFTGAGFTTSESELIANNPKRKKIALACMYTGHIFSVAFMGLVINVIFSVIILVTSAPEIPTFTEWCFIVLYVCSWFLLLVLFSDMLPLKEVMQNAHLKDKYNITVGIIKRKDEYVFVDKDTIIKKAIH